MQDLDECDGQIVCMVMTSSCLSLPGLSEPRRHGNEHSSNRPLKTCCCIPLDQLHQIELIYRVVRLEIDLEKHLASSSVRLDPVVDFRNVIHPGRTERYRPVDRTSATLPDGITEGLADGVGLPSEHHRVEAASPNQERLQRFCDVTLYVV